MMLRAFSEGEGDFLKFRIFFACSCGLSFRKGAKIRKSAKILRTLFIYSGAQALRGVF